jgi:NADPH-dependent F420 reductase
MHVLTRIGLIGGTGKEGQGLALRFVAAGYTVMIGSRDADRARDIVAGLQDRAVGGALEGDSNAEVVAACDVNVLSVPFAHAASTLDGLRSAFRPGSLLIDVTVPVSFGGGAVRYADVAEGSAAEQVRRHLPEGVGLAGAFKTVPAYLLGKSDRPLDCDTFVCGDSPESRRRAIEVLEPLEGLRTVDVGDLESARALERMTVLLININRHYKIHDGRFRILGLDAGTG